MQILNKKIIVYSKSCLILGYIIILALIFSLHLEFMTITIIIIVKTYVSQNTLILVQCNKEC